MMAGGGWVSGQPENPPGYATGVWYILIMYIKFKLQTHKLVHVISYPVYANPGTHIFQPNQINYTNTRTTSINHRLISVFVPFEPKAQIVLLAHRHSLSILHLYCSVPTGAKRNQINNWSTGTWKESKPSPSWTHNIRPVSIYQPQ